MAWRKRLILARMPGAGPVRTVPLIEEPEIPEVPEVVIPEPNVAIPDTLVRLDTLPVRDTTAADTTRRDSLLRDVPF